MQAALCIILSNGGVAVCIADMYIVKIPAHLHIQAWPLMCVSLDVVVSTVDSKALAKGVVSGVIQHSPTV